MAAHTPISLRESALLLQLFPLTQEQRPILSKEGFWWGRIGLNLRLDFTNLMLGAMKSSRSRASSHFSQIRNADLARIQRRVHPNLLVETPLGLFLRHSPSFAFWRCSLKELRPKI